MYLFILPLLTILLSAVMPKWTDYELSEKAVLLIPYYASFLLAVLLFKDYLIDNLHAFGARLGRSVFSMFLSYVLLYAITFAMALLLAGWLGSAENPNDSAVEELAKLYNKPTVVIAVFLAPLIEEILFRGMIFGSIWKKNRFFAYLISWLLFGAAHLVQYAILYGDWKVLALMFEYLPPSIAWAWCYRRSGSIWTSVFMHMLYNGMSMWVLAHPL
jgi:membrane protease YdiL (CAAX protease family)